MSCGKCGTECRTFGECIRNKGLRVGFCRSEIRMDKTADKAWYKELDLYASAVKQGVQPAGTQTHQIREALDMSDKLGKAYDAGAPVTLLED